MANDLYDKLSRDLFKLRDQGNSYAGAKARLWDTVQGEPDKFLEMFFHNWFNNNWVREEPKSVHLGPLRPPEPAPDRAPAPRSEYKPQLRERSVIDAQQIGLALLNSFLPDGKKRLKDATGKEIRQYGGWLLLIAKHVKPAETVGRKLTPEQAANLWTQAQK